MSDPTQALIDECCRQEENCSYTATSFIVWLRCLRWVRTFCLSAPVVFGALATWKVLEQSSMLAAVFTLLTTVIPPAYRSSRLDDAIKDYETKAGEFTNIRDRFRQAALVHSQKPYTEFEAITNELIARLEKARSSSLTPPQWCFKIAQRQIKAGHYCHDYDQARSEHPRSAL